MSETTETNLDAPLSIFDICETDTKAEEDGRWFKDIFNDGTNIDVKLRRLSSRPSMQARRVLDKGYRKYFKNGKYPDDIAIEILTKQLAKAVLIDWAGIRGRDGEVIPYTETNAYELLSKLPTFRDIVVLMSQNLDNFRVEELEEIEGN